MFRKQLIEQSVIGKSVQYLKDKNYFCKSKEIIILVARLESILRRRKIYLGGNLNCTVSFRPVKPSRVFIIYHPP